MQTCRVFKECGDALEAEQIAAQTKKIIHKQVKKGSSAHNIQALVLSNYAYCVIERPLRGVVAGKPKKASNK
jgi:hypothetical protein